MTKLTAMAVQAINVAKRAFGAARLPFTSVTIAITVVTGVIKRNHRVNISARFSGNQCGIRRSIGNARRNNKNPTKAGKHQRSGLHILPLPGDILSGFVAVVSVIGSILTV